VHSLGCVARIPVSTGWAASPSPAREEVHADGARDPRCTYKDNVFLMSRIDKVLLSENSIVAKTALRNRFR